KESVANCKYCKAITRLDFTGNWSAAIDGDLERVKSFLQKDTANYTALHYASHSRHESVRKFLLWGGTCANPHVPGGATPLHRSAYCGHPLCDYDGSSPLHKAAEQGHEEVCRLLFQCCPSLSPDGLLKELLEHPQ
uniref:Ankyrin repeat domain 39 n=1 Tax=Salmo trutta TaxID=8032 RepID=A0A673YHK7_SALTR